MDHRPYANLKTAALEGPMQVSERARAGEGKRETGLQAL